LHPDKKLSTIPKELKISGNKIERVRTYKCLGWELDEKLDIHRASSLQGDWSLGRLQPLFPHSTLVLIYLFRIA
jgi:hypothetical protein